MNSYGIYKNARNASWKCLIACNVVSLPVKPVKIAKQYDLQCKKATSEELCGRAGEIEKLSGIVYISFNMDDIVTRQRFTVMHELGHYVLGHLGDEPLSRSESECRLEQEQAADKFAIDVLAPACVLWGIGLYTPEKIADLCQISMQAARIRANRMQKLYHRNMFLTHPLEQQVFEQFQDFIRKNK